MQSIEVLKADIREISGTGDARALRRAGKIPATLYGKNKPSISISVSEKETVLTYKKGMFTSKILGLELDGKQIKVVPKKVDLHQVKETIEHIDFIYLNEDTQVVDVPIIFTDQDKSPGVKKGGFFNVVIRKLKLECPVNSIPSHISMSIEHMYVGYKIQASDFVIPNGCKLLTPGKRIIASVTGKGSQDQPEQASAPVAATTATPAKAAAAAPKPAKK